MDLRTDPLSTSNSRSQASGPGAGTTSALMRQKISAEQIRMLYQQAPTAIGGGIMATLGCAFVLWDVTAIGLWAVLVLACNLALLLVLLRYVTTKPVDEKLSTYRTFFHLQSIVHGFLWGMLTYFALQAEQAWVLTFAIVVALGMAAGSISTTASVYRTFVSYVTFVMLPACYVMLFSTDEVYWNILGILGSIYYGVLLLAGYNFNLSIRNSLALRFENTDLIDQLLTEKSRTEHALQGLEKEIIQREQSEADARRARRDAEAANLAKSQFIANMSHEIRSPLTSIIGYAENLQSGITRQDDINSSINTILRNSQHLLTLINDILDLSKIEADKLEVENKPTAILDVVDDLVEVFGLLAKEKGLELKLNLLFPLPDSIQSDITRLRQILFNLLNNALKFTQLGEVSLTVRYLSEARQLLLEVKDSGIGISKKELETLFRPFVQADASITRKYGGTGLGLMISRRLARLLGGDLAVESEPGVGSCFTLSLNVREVTELVTHRSARLSGAPVTQSTDFRFSGNVLLVEDSPDIQHLVKARLEKLGAGVVTADNGQQAVDIASERVFDLILMDNQMPVMDGCAAVKILRERHYTQPIVILSANAMEQDQSGYFDAGADAFLSKPVVQDQFVAVLEKYLTRIPLKPETLNDFSDEEYAEIYRKFYESLQRHKGKLEEAVEKKDMSIVKQSGHVLKGMGGSFGFPEITELGLKFENAAQEQDLSTLAVLLEKLNSQLSRL